MNNCDIIFILIVLEQHNRLLPLSEHCWHSCSSAAAVGLYTTAALPAIIVAFNMEHDAVPYHFNSTVYSC